MMEFIINKLDNFNYDAMCALMLPSEFHVFNSLLSNKACQRELQANNSKVSVSMVVNKSAFKCQGRDCEKLVLRGDFELAARYLNCIKLKAEVQNTKELEKTVRRFATL